MCHVLHFYLPAENTLLRPDQIKKSNFSKTSTFTKVVVGLDSVPTTGAVCYIVCECRCGKVFALMHYSSVNIRHMVLIICLLESILKLPVGIECYADRRLICASDNMRS